MVCGSQGRKAESAEECWVQVCVGKGEGKIDTNLPTRLTGKLRGGFRMAGVFSGLFSQLPSHGDLKVRKQSQIYFLPQI